MRRARTSALRPSATLPLTLWSHDLALSTAAASTSNRGSLLRAVLLHLGLTATTVRFHFRLFVSMRLHLGLVVAVRLDLGLLMVGRFDVIMRLLHASIAFSHCAARARFDNLDTTVSASDLACPTEMAGLYAVAVLEVEAGLAMFRDRHAFSMLPDLAGRTTLRMLDAVAMLKM